MSWWEFKRTKITILRAYELVTYAGNYQFARLQTSLIPKEVSRGEKINFVASQKYETTSNLTP